MKRLFCILLMFSSLVAMAQEPTVVGHVTCAGRPVAGAVVSDGEQIVLTDEQGYYSMVSKKPCGYVFLSIPSGYEVDAAGLVPYFFGYTTKSKQDQIDFQLKRAKNDKFTLFVSTDTHLRGDPHEFDLPQYRKWYLGDIIGQIERTKGKVYSVDLGDMTTDVMWHSNYFGLRKFLDAKKTYPTPVFAVPGNHDNERFISAEVPDSLWDKVAQEPYRMIMGPNYYSLNLGKAHFVMLDNTIVRKGINAKGKHETKNDYWLDDMQARWLEKDLALVDDETPVIVCMHVPIWHNGPVGENGESTYKVIPGLAKMESQIMPLIKRFKTVHFLTGHTHRFDNVKVSENIYQHNMPSTSAQSWKINGPESRLVCDDGSPGGYMIYTFNGKDISWKFKPEGYAIADNQFRVYDLNTVPEEFGGKPGSNQVLVNVYAWDEDWKVTVKENGREIQAKRVVVKDPLYWLVRKDAIPGRPTAFLAIPTSHMFIVETSGPDTSLDISVTDKFGKRYKQKVLRPKKFDWQTD